MRKFLVLFAFLAITTISFGQINLPINFEGSVITTDFVDFDGGVATVMANPQSNGTNTSATVGQIIRSVGEIWAGSKITLASNLDFSTNNAISMQVFTMAPVGTTIRVKLEGGGSFAEIDVVTTVSGAWETLTWDFSGTPATFADLVFMFDFGNVGDGSATSTFLFDDVMQTTIATGPQVALPIDFESSIVTADFTDFDGGVATVLPNPQSMGTNTSATVAQIVRNGGEIWAGSKVTLSNNLDFSTNNAISMQVFTTAPVGTVIRIKLEGGGSFAEKDVTTTVSSAWETLTWDFTGTPTSFRDLVFMFDFGNTGNGSVASTFLFDDVMQTMVGGTGTQIDLPVTFEDTTVNYTMTDFGENQSMLVVDPTDPSNMAMEVIKTAIAETWAGTTIGRPSGFATNIPLTLANSTMSVRVWSPDANTPIRLKVEDSNDPTHTCETEVNTTVAGGWETLVFDFATEAPGTAALSFGLNSGWTYNMASIFFNFGTDGATAGAKTYYFDDVMFGGSSTGGNLSQIDLPVTFEETTVNYTLSDFGDNSTVLGADPMNAAQTVAISTKLATAQSWAGTTVSTPAGLANPIPFSASETKMSVRVYSPDAGTPVLLKVENTGDGNLSTETLATTTVANAWETLVFDFNNNQPNTPALDLNVVYDKVSIFFNFGTDGATAGAKTYYWDDVYFGDPVSTNGLNTLAVTAFPNPVKDQLQINVEGQINEVLFFNTLGQLVLAEQVNGDKNIFNIGQLPRGVYFVQVKTNDAIGSLKIIKE